MEVGIEALSPEYTFLGFVTSSLRPLCKLKPHRPSDQADILRSKTRLRREFSNVPG